MLYNAPSGSTDPNAPYVGKNVAAGIQGSKVPPTAAEYPQREIVNLITTSGQSPTNADLFQLTRGVRGGKLSYYEDIGAANTPAIAPNPAHTTLFDGLHVRVKMKFAPTGPTTLTINGLVAPVKRRSGAALVGAEWAAGDVLDLVYATVSGVGSFQIVTLTRSDIAAMIAAAQVTPPAVADTSLWHIGSATTGTATAMATVLSPVPPSAANGICMRVPITQTNGPAATLDFGFGYKPLVSNITGTTLKGGEMPGGVGYEADIEFDGTSARLMNPVVDTSLWHIGVAGGTATALTTTLSPAPTALVDGICMRVAISVMNGPNATIDFGFGPKLIVLNSNSAGLSGGEMPGGLYYIADLEYGGGAVRLLNPSLTGGTPLGTFAAPKTFTSSQSFTPDPGCKAFRYKLTGGAGGGASGTAPRAGGGGGEYREGVVAVTPGTSYSIIIGGGGTAGGAGGDSSIVGIATAKGGQPGSGNSGGSGGTGGSGGFGRDGQTGMSGVGTGDGNGPSGNYYFPGAGGASYGFGTNFTFGTVRNGYGFGVGGTAGNSIGGTPTGGSGTGGVCVIEQLTGS